MATGKMLFRVDGTYCLGTGNVQRCLVLAHYFENLGFDVHFVTKYNLSYTLIQQAGFHPFEVKTQSRLVELMAVLQPRVILIDTPQETLLSAKIRQTFKSKVFLVGMDISRRYWPYFDMVISLSYLKYKDLGKYGLTGRCLSGLEHMIIAPEYGQLSSAFKVKNSARRILACFGGSDVHDFSQSVITALADEKAYEIELVVGPGYRNLGTLKNQIKDCPNIHLAVNCRNMAERMVRSDIGIFCFGTLAFEAACIGLPMVVVAPSKMHLEIEDVVRKKYTAVGWQMLGERQHLSSQGLQQAVSGLLANHALRVKMSQCGQKIVDGKGAERICRIIHERVGG